VDELVIRSNQGSRSLVIRGDAPHGDYWVARLDGESINATRRFYALGRTFLDDFFAELAAQWRGWVGDKTWSALEGDALLAASHDGLGTVSLLAELRGEPSSRAAPAWRAALVLELDAGALDRLARDAKRLG
jgi:hypothetical protein